MPEEAKAEKWFYRNAQSGGEEGPLDLVEMAGLLRSGDITPETMTKTKDDSDWLIFSKRREYPWARDMPLGVIMKHLEIKNAKPESPFTPRRLYYLGALLLGVGLYVVKLFFHTYYMQGNNHDSNQWLARLLDWLTHHQHQ